MNKRVKKLTDGWMSNDEHWQMKGTNAWASSTVVYINV